MNLDTIYNYYKNIENENKLYLAKIEELTTKLNQLQTDITDLSKVSMISSMDKQLKDKLNNIELLEKQVDRLTKNNKELTSQNQTLTNQVQLLTKQNQELSSINLELEEQVNKKKNKKKYDTITYKEIDYLVDGDNNVYDIVGNKPNNIVGLMKNNKIKFNK